MKDFLHLLKNYWFEFLLFAVVATFFYFGTSRIFPTEGEEGTSTGVFFAIICSGFLFYYIDGKRKRIERLENALLVSAANDANWLTSLEKNFIEKYSPTRNLPLAVYLEKSGLLEGYRRDTSEIYPGVKSMMGIFKPPNIEEISNLVEKRTCFGLFQALEKFDEIVRDMLPGDLLKRSPEACYFIRLNDLDLLCRVLKGEKIKFDADEPGLKNLHEFRKLVFHKFFADSERRDEFPAPEKIDFEALKSEVIKDVSYGNTPNPSKDKK